MPLRAARIRWQWLLAGLPGIAICPCLAQQSPRPPLVLSLPGSVRQAGLAGAGTALIGDAGSVFSNPAGLAPIKYLSVEGGFSLYPDGTRQGSASAGLRLGPMHVGGGGSYLQFNDSASVRSNLMWVGTLGYRFGLISLGSSAKYVASEDSSGHVDRGFTQDIGVAMALFDISSIGFSVQNVGNHRLSEVSLTLPTTYRLGFMLNFTDPQTTARLLGTIETIWTRDEDRRTVLGFEAGLVVSGVGLVVRVGHGGQPPASGQSKWTYGGGVLLGRLRFDYA
ncbi:MAG: hypothetical protein ABI836_04295, partial [Gemmatimonadota bacterium]